MTLGFYCGSFILLKAPAGTMFSPQAKTKGKPDFGRDLKINVQL